MGPYLEERRMYHRELHWHGVRDMKMILIFAMAVYSLAVLLHSRTCASAPIQPSMAPTHFPTVIVSSDQLNSTNKPSISTQEPINDIAESLARIDESSTRMAEAVFQMADAMVRMATAVVRGPWPEWPNPWPEWPQQWS
jgi:hypothetical protein